MEIVFFLVLTTTVAALAGVYANKLGRSGLGWFLFAFFVPFGIIIVWPILLGMGQTGVTSELRETEKQVRLLEAKGRLAELQKAEVSQ